MWNPSHSSLKVKYSQIPKDKVIRRAKLFYVVFKNCNGTITRLHRLVKNQLKATIDKAYAIHHCIVSHCVYYYSDILSWR